MSDSEGEEEIEMTVTETVQDDGSILREERWKNEDGKMMVRRIIKRPKKK